MYRCNICDTEFDCPKYITQKAGLILATEYEDVFVCPCCNSGNFEDCRCNWEIENE